MSGTRKLRTADDCDRFTAALLPVDEAFFASEQRWGVGRLERIVSPSTLAAYRRGWQRYRAAIEAGDGEQLEMVGPLMVTALAVMAAEAEAAGHAPLDVSTWEAALPDGAVLVVVRSNAEASAVIRAQKAATMFSVAPNGGGTRVGLPPDVMLSIRQQHEGRALEVWTVAEIARLVATHGSVVGDRSDKRWEGEAVASGRQRDEMAAHDHARDGYPLSVDTLPVAVSLPF